MARLSMEYNLETRYPPTTTIELIYLVLSILNPVLIAYGRYKAENPQSSAYDSFSNICFIINELHVRTLV